MVNVADELTGFACPATSGNVAVGVPNETGPGPLVSLHVVLSVAPTGSPSSVTLPVNVVVAGVGKMPKLALTIRFVFAANHKLPSAPAVIQRELPVRPVANSVITPAVVILPI